MSETDNYLNVNFQCPMCGRSYQHTHPAEEVLIYRNGVKYGRSLQKSGKEIEQLLRDLVSALDGAFISVWQSTASWQKQLDAAKEFLK